MDPLTVTGFGARGVNTVDSPLHRDDADLEVGQNAEVFLEDGYPGLRKRLGMGVVNSAALSGTVFGVSSIPLPDPFPSPDAFAAGMILWFDISPFNKGTTDGSSFSNTGLSAADPGNALPATKYIIVGGVTYYPKASPLGTILSYNQVAEATAFSFPNPQTIDGDSWDFLQVNGVCADSANQYWLVTYDRSGERAWIVWKVDSGFAITQIGEVFSTDAAVSGRIALDAGSSVDDIAFWAGDLWLGVREFNAGPLSSQARIYTITPGETAWTLDTSFGGTGSTDNRGGAQLLLAGATYLVHCCNPSGSTRALVRVRDSSAWTTIATSPGTTGDFYWPVYNLERLIVALARPGGNDTTLLQSTDFTSLPTTLNTDVATAVPHSKSVTFSGASYFLCGLSGDVVVRKLSGATVSSVLTVTGAAMVGIAAFPAAD